MAEKKISFPCRISTDSYVETLQKQTFFGHSAVFTTTVVKARQRLACCCLGGEMQCKRPMGIVASVAKRPDVTLFPFAGGCQKEDVVKRKSRVFE
jgi:hypothetical protein